MSTIIELKRHKSMQAKISSEIANQPTKTTDISDVKKMAELISKETSIAREITEIEREINSNNKWRAKLTQASDIAPVEIEWLWPQWIALGKLTVLAGAGGTGKTTMALSLAATLTVSGMWPDGAVCKAKGNVIIWSSEDDPRDTLVPRLIAAGADLERVLIIEGRIGPAGQLEPFDPATDWDTLYSSVMKIGGVSLLILDPVVNLIKGDMHRANDVRRGLQKIVDFASSMDCAVLGISHFSKGSAGASAADRVIGSQAFSALARTVLVVGKHDNSELRVLARAKSNISIDQGGYSYSIEHCTIRTKEDHCIETTKTVWGDFIEGSASEILSATESANSSKEYEPAVALKAVLQTGRMNSREAEEVMKANGYSPKQSRTARNKLNVNITRTGYGSATRTYWELPNLPKVNSDDVILSGDAQQTKESCKGEVVN